MRLILGKSDVFTDRTCGIIGEIRLRECTDLRSDTGGHQQAVGRDGGRSLGIYNDAAPNPRPKLLSSMRQAPV